MTDLTEIILAIILFTNIALVAASRLFHCIRIIAVQGLLIGLLPLALLIADTKATPSYFYFAAAINIAVKFFVLPTLLAAATRRTNARRELEPFVGYCASVAIVFAAIVASFFACSSYGIVAESSAFAIPTSLATICTGLFMIIARRKAITQAIGFLTFENGIAVFGSAIMLDYGLVVELGILLDVLVLIFILGIAIFHISREFAHIDADRLNTLGDNCPASPPDALTRP